MIIPISINTDDITSQFDVSPQQIESILDGVAKNLAVIYYNKLEEKANQELHSTRRRYLSNLKLVDEGKLKAGVLLDYSKDKLIKSIEEGAAAFDMKEGILNGPKAKTSKKGKKYSTIPLRWSTPGALGESEVFSNKLPQEIYDLVKKQPQSSNKPNTTTPLSASLIPQHLQIASSRPQVTGVGDKVFQEYQHKSSIYEGITRTTDKTTGQSVYNSFRRVSENSDPNAFIHPGFVAKQLMNKTMSEFKPEEEMGNLLDNELAKLGF